MTFLTTGAAGGLGRYLHERLGGLALTRKTSPREFNKIKRNGADVIVHCAASSARSWEVDQDSLYRYLEDGVFLTRTTVRIPHKKFVLLSSVDVYPRNGRRHREDEAIPADAVSGVYAMNKLMSEAVVRHESPDSLILRPTSLLGPYARKSSLTRLLEGERPLTLSGDSELNYVRCSDILDFIREAVARGWRGTFNAASARGITLRGVASLFGKKPKFGTHRYRVGDIDNGKIARLAPAFRAGSREVLASFFEVSA